MSEEVKSACAERTVRRSDFLKDPGATLKRAEREGPVVVRDSAGCVRAVVSVPTKSLLSRSDDE